MSIVATIQNNSEVDLKSIKIGHPCSTTRAVHVEFGVTRDDRQKKTK